MDEHAAGGSRAPQRTGRRRPQTVEPGLDDDWDSLSAGPTSLGSESSRRGCSHRCRRNRPQVNAVRRIKQVHGEKFQNPCPWTFDLLTPQRKIILASDWLEKWEIGCLLALCYTGSRESLVSINAINLILSFGGIIARPFST